MPRRTSVSTSCFRSIEAGGVLLGMDAHVAVIAHREIAFAPTGDIVEVAGQLRGPAFGGLHDQGAFAAVSFQFLLSPFGLKLLVSDENSRRATKIM